MQETITFSYTDGSMTICLDEFFPCSMERLDKLLDAVADTWDMSAAQATRAKMAAHCQDRARDLEEKLPGLQRMADGAMTSVRIAEKQLRETQARIRELMLDLKKKDLVTRKKIRDQADVMRQLRDSQKRTLKSAKEYAYQTAKERTVTANTAERLRKCRERILTWEKRKRTNW